MCLLCCEARGLGIQVGSKEKVPHALDFFPLIFATLSTEARPFQDLTLP